MRKINFEILNYFYVLLVLQHRLLKKVQMLWHDIALTLTRIVGYLVENFRQEKHER